MHLITVGALLVLASSVALGEEPAVFDVQPNSFDVSSIISGVASELSELETPTFLNEEIHSAKEVLHDGMENAREMFKTKFGSMDNVKDLFAKGKDMFKKKFDKAKFKIKASFGKVKSKIKSSFDKVKAGIQSEIAKVHTDLKHIPGGFSFSLSVGDQTSGKVAPQTSGEVAQAANGKPQEAESAAADTAVNVHFEQPAVNAELKAFEECALFAVNHSVRPANDSGTRISRASRQFPISLRAHLPCLFFFYLTQKDTAVKRHTVEGHRDDRVAAEPASGVQSVKLTMDGSISDYGPEELEKVKRDISATVGVPSDQIVLSVTAPSVPQESRELAVVPQAETAASSATSNRFAFGAAATAVGCIALVSALIAYSVRQHRIRRYRQMDAQLRSLA